MERKIDKYFDEWKQNNNKNPIILSGSTMVGKSYSVLKFGKEKYSQYIYINLEYNPLVVSLLNKEINVDRLFEKLCLLYNKDSNNLDTLIIFDNVDYYDKLIPVLLRFKDSKNNYSVISICNSIKLPQNNTSYVGKITFHKMYKMSFEEFLTVNKQPGLAEFINESFKLDKKFRYHDLAFEYFSKYLVIGGYPSVVKTYLETKDMSKVLLKQHEIIKNINNYIFKNYEGNKQKILSSFSSLPMQLFKSNKKFQYGTIKKGARQSEYKGPIDWMKKHEIYIKCLKVKKINRSIAGAADDASFKLFLNDSGLLSSLYGINYDNILDKKWQKHLYAILQNYIASTLYENGYPVYYYESEGKASVPFVIQSMKGEVIPIDIERRKKAKNITQFTKDNNIKKAINFTFDNFSKNGNIINIPIYAVYCLKKGD